MKSWAKRVDLSSVLIASAFLIWFGRSFDFFCDDAFITLRYAENLAHHGEPNYNLAERVEGYTSFVWLLLSAFGALLPVKLTSYVQVIGALSGVGIVAATGLCEIAALPFRSAVMLTGPCWWSGVMLTMP